MEKDGIVKVIREYPNDELTSDFKEYNMYLISEDSMRKAINEIGIENILENPNYVNAIVSRFNKKGYYSFIMEVNGFYFDSTRNNKNVDDKFKTLRSPEFAEAIMSKSYEKMDFVSYTIAFMLDSQTINNVICAASKDEHLLGSISRGINGMQQNVISLSNVKHEKDVYPYVALASDYAASEKLGLELEIMDGILKGVENPNAKIYLLEEINKKLHETHQMIEKSTKSMISDRISMTELYQKTQEQSGRAM